MDEYVGLPRNHPESYHSFMYAFINNKKKTNVYFYLISLIFIERFENFFKHIDIDPKNAHILGYL